MSSQGSLTLPRLFAERRPTDPAAPLLIDPWLTYEDAWARAGGIAKALAKAGVVPGDRVVVKLEKSPGVLLLYLACIRSGAVLLPMNPAFTAAEVDHVLADADPRLFIDDEELLDAAPSEFDDVAVEPDDLAAILYTSGTTGRPKGAMLRHSNLAANAAATRTAWGFGGDDVLLHSLPVFHNHGLFIAINCVLANGTSMIFLPRFDVDAIIENIPRSTVFMGVPTYYTRLLDDPRLDSELCRDMRLFISGSAPLLPSIQAAFEARTGHQIVNRYGMTETAVLTSNPLHGPRKPDSVGLPVPGVEVRVTGERGDVEVRGPNVFPGYWRRPDLAGTEFTDDGWFRTGDVGSFDDDGYLILSGRSKDLVISGGLNVYPREVEEILDAVPGVLESAVVGLPDPDLGEAVTAVVVVRPGSDADETAIRQAARQHLAGYKVPKRVHFVDALPRNTMGKVQKTVLREQFG